jgi:protein-tyrosine phosphatase
MHREDPYRICFVCSGNICRSPMAEAVLRRLAADAGLGDRIAVDSAGTGEWHIGERADLRTLRALAATGYDAARTGRGSSSRRGSQRLDLV